MSRFIKKSNLPESKVTSLICGGLNREMIDYLKSRDIEIFYTKENPFVEKSVSNHCDLSALYVGDGKIIIDKGQALLSKKLTSKGFNVKESVINVKGKYPGDVILNHAVVGNFIIGKSNSFDPTVKAEFSGYRIIDTKQGYSKCSVLVVDENSIITDDVSIDANCRKYGIDSLLISKGDIHLDGQNYGFIGGSSGKLSNDEVVFFGDITAHRDYSRIKDFLDKRDMKIISFAFPLTDFGGIIPVKERII